MAFSSSSSVARQAPLESGMFSHIPYGHIWAMGRTLLQYGARLALKPCLACEPEASLFLQWLCNVTTIPQEVSLHRLLQAGPKPSQSHQVPDGGHARVLGTARQKSKKKRKNKNMKKNKKKHNKNNKSNSNRNSTATITKEEPQRAPLRLEQKRVEPQITQDLTQAGTPYSLGHFRSTSAVWKLNLPTACRKHFS